MSFSRLETNAATSRCSASGTPSFAIVRPAWPRKACQSPASIRMPRWDVRMSRPV
jgi:hypothetical protein